MMDSIPRLGFGTWARTGADGVAAILCALETGYRHLDTAQSYGTEQSVGEAMRQSGLKRDEIFVTTKIKVDNLDPGKLLPSLRQSCDAIGVDQVDLTLIHWPAPYGRIEPETYLAQIAEARELGLTRMIGVSNFTIALLDKAEALLGKGAVATNQIELNPLFQNRRIAGDCKERGILVTCYQPVAQGRMGDIEPMRAIAARHGATVEQVALAYELGKGYAAIPTSSKPERIRSNWQAHTVKLTAADIEAIDALGQASRAIDPPGAPLWD
ncbi:MAG: aldo/keto reductase [Rhizobium sp.]|nr:MAG: aldo/keto reductase [Rhizobium sp.]